MQLTLAQPRAEVDVVQTQSTGVNNVDCMPSNGKLNNCRTPRSPIVFGLSED
jgi:hypothetical protein